MGDPLNEIGCPRLARGLPLLRSDLHPSTKDVSGPSEASRRGGGARPSEELSGRES